MLELRDLILDLKGEIPEGARYKVAQKIADLFGQKLTNPEAHKQWIYSERNRFISDCEFETRIPDELWVEPTKIQKFCSKWIGATLFKYSDESEWRPITAEQNALRMTMIKELVELSHKSS
jgi:hypothetical protein